ncbi:hypothetical protein NED98_10540 [Sphingomonas sp. MMSM20]|uniref:hypothetical protein n=1 Tax=Sphingomonas lycopersici TaxID=2951807 RepID=UPI002237AF7C|nr:hypothetical protein [Sphingomonas lycopersici]MCW6530685.1 hypothetical protein [Sphingomonas lycopersici]
MYKFNDKLGETYEADIAWAVVAAVIDQTSLDGVAGVVNVGRAIDGILQGLAMMCTNCGQTKTPAARKEIADYARKRLLRELAATEMVTGQSGWAPATPIMAN